MANESAIGAIGGNYATTPSSLLGTQNYFKGVGDGTAQAGAINGFTQVGSEISDRLSSGQINK